MQYYFPPQRYEPTAEANNIPSSRNLITAPPKIPIGTGSRKTLERRGGERALGRRAVSRGASTKIFVPIELIAQERRGRLFNSARRGLFSQEIVDPVGPGERFAAAELSETAGAPKTTARKPRPEQPPLRNNRPARVASSNHPIFLGARSRERSLRARRINDANDRRRAAGRIRKIITRLDVP